MSLEKLPAISSENSEKKRRPRLSKKESGGGHVLSDTYSYIESGLKEDLKKNDVDFLYEKLSAISEKRPASTTAEINSIQHYLYKLEQMTDEELFVYKKAELLPLMLVDLMERVFDKTESHLASQYDDIVNGVDLVIIDGFEVAGVALDATIQKDFNKTKMNDGVLERKTKFGYLSDVVIKRKLKKVNHVVSSFYNDISVAAVPLVVSGTETDLVEYKTLYEKLDAGEDVEFNKFPFLCVFIEQCTYQIDKLIEVLEGTSIREYDDTILLILKNEKKNYDNKKEIIKENFPRYSDVVKSHPNTISLKNTFDAEISSIVSSMK